MPVTVDHQRARVYRWEKEAFAMWDWPLMTLAECRSAARHVLLDYGIPRNRLPVVMAHGTRPSAAWLYPSDIPPNGAIVLGEPFHILPVVLHECAHVLIDDAHAWHGPEFVGVYINLLVEYADLSALALVRSARDCGVQFELRYPVSEIVEDAKLRLPSSA